MKQKPEKPLSLGWHSVPRSFVESAIIESKLSDVRPPNLLLSGSPVFGKNLALRAKKPLYIIFLFFRFVEPVFLLTKYVASLQETRARGGYFYLSACI